MSVVDNELSVHRTKQEHLESAKLHQGDSGPDPGPSAEFGSGLLPEFNTDFLVQSYVCDKLFTNIRSVFQETSAKLWKMPHRRTGLSAKRT